MNKWNATTNPGVCQVYNHQPRTRVQGFGNGGKSIHAKRQPTHHASIRNQHPRSTCKHHRNPSFFSMKPHVYKRQKMGGSWNANGGWFSLPCFLKWNHTKPRLSSVCPLKVAVPHKLFPQLWTMIALRASSWSNEINSFCKKIAPGGGNHDHDHK